MLEFALEESTCLSDAAMLPMALPMSEWGLAVGAQAFAAKGTGKCSVMVGEEVGGRELSKQVVRYIADSVAICNMYCLATTSSRFHLWHSKATRIQATKIGQLSS